MKKAYVEEFKEYLLTKFAYCRENKFICGYVEDREDSIAPPDIRFDIVDTRQEWLEACVTVEDWVNDFVVWVPTLNDSYGIYLDSTELSYDDLFKKYFIVLKEVKL